MGFEQRIAGSVEVTCTPGIMGGMPCIAGTRVPAETILDSINHGEWIEEIHDAYPYLPLGSVEAVVRWAKQNGLPCTAS